MFVEILQVLYLFALSTIGTIGLWSLIRSKEKYKYTSDKFAFIFLTFGSFSMILASLSVPLEIIIEKHLSIEIPVSIFYSIMFVFFILSVLIYILKNKNDS